MSWQAYVDNNLVGTGRVQRAAIFGHDGSCWATSPGFTVSENVCENFAISYNYSRIFISINKTTMTFFIF